MIPALILAAGESSRMGSDKALLAYRGSTFLEQVIETLRSAGLERVTVVLGHHATEIQRAVKIAGTEVLVNQDYHLGQTSSLQTGLRALNQPEVQAVVLCLVDHPAVSENVIKSLVATFRRSRAPVVIPTYQGQRGHPVLIARPLFAELLALNPTEGANSVVRKYHKATEFVEVKDDGIVIDIDDPKAYLELHRHAPNNG
ncbi:MAG TPA: nucleotidyltransferase family protein [Terriglobia bacterium]|nr:nucleotidyltransferase family protein [Terriglobia bacterium]